MIGATRYPTRGFVAYDPEGYSLEFETFLDHAQNGGRWRGSPAYTLRTGPG